jgi:SNF2 family DNA or RNA helicase
MDGQSSFEDRAKIVDQFDNDPSIRVLFFTSVGSYGLNLSVANHVIFVVCASFQLFDVHF